MTPPLSGETQIGMAADLIKDSFARRQGAGHAPDLRLALKLVDQIVQIDVHGAGLAEHLGGIFRHLVVETASERTALHIELAELFEPDLAALHALSVPAPGLVATPAQGHTMVELYPGFAIAADLAVPHVTAIWGGGGRLPPSHLSHPFAHAFGWLGAQRQTYVTHGAAIGRDGRGLLLAGCGGQGKSTTALVCAGAGWEFAGDDLMMLECCDDGDWAAHSLYASGRLHPAQAARFPSLAPNWDSVLSPEENKLTLFPPAGAVSLARRLTIEAIVLPMVGPQGEAEIGPLSRPAALRSLMGDSVRIYPFLTRERAQFYAAAVEQLPCYTLRVGPDIAAIPGAVGRILDRAIATRSGRVPGDRNERRVI